MLAAFDMSCHITTETINLPFSNPEEMTDRLTASKARARRHMTDTKPTLLLARAYHCIEQIEMDEKLRLQRCPPTAPVQTRYSPYQYRSDVVTTSFGWYATSRPEIDTAVFFCF